MKKRLSCWLLILCTIVTFVPSCESPNAAKSNDKATRPEESLTYIANLKGEFVEEIFQGAREVKSALAKHGIDIVIEGGLGVYDISVKTKDASRAIKILKAEPSLQRLGLEIVQK